MTTPATAQDLSAALISALESNTVSPVAAPNDVTFDILLAEDNLVNQKLAVKILEKYGHAVEIAENGSLAVDSFKLRVAQGRPFDIVLVRPFFSSSSRPPPFDNEVLFCLFVWVGLLMIFDSIFVDGCVYAVYGWYGGD